MNPGTQQPTAPPGMPAPTGGGPRSRSPLATAIVVGALGVLTAVAWVTGGLRAQPTAPDQVRPGAAVDQGRFSVQVIGAWTGAAKVRYETKNVPVLIVRMRVTNTGKDTVAMAGSTFGFAAGVLLGPAPYRPPDDVRNDPARGAADSLQPRLTRAVDVMWKLAGPPPRRAVVALRQWTYRLQFDGGAYYWSTGKDATTVAEVTVPVRQGAAG
ncbi:MAG TPA: hypothetical protein VF069_22830 [Streptosporangiaceae bacterium]